MNASPCILIVDRDNETHEVLETVLARQGVSTLRACGARAGLRLVRECHPDVVVVDLDTAGDDPSDVGCEALQEAVHREAISLVLVGTHRGAGGTEDAFVRKPYQYGPLVRKIEGLLDRRKVA